jgi:hypothetical protein
MLVQENIQFTKDFVYIKVGGSYTGKDEVPGLMNLAAETAAANNIKKILIDLSAVKGDFPLFDKYELAESAASIWGYKFKTALIYNIGINTGLFENVAVNRGGNLRVVANRQEAEEWLVHS